MNVFWVIKVTYMFKMILVNYLHKKNYTGKLCVRYERVHGDTDVSKIIQGDIGKLSVQNETGKLRV